MEQYWLNQGSDTHKFELKTQLRRLGDCNYKKAST